MGVVWEYQATTLTPGTPHSAFVLQVGDEAAGWSDVFSFTTLTDGTNIMTMAVFGECVALSCSRSLLVPSLTVAAVWLGVQHG